MSTSKLYYVRAKPPALSIFEKLAAAIPKKNNSDVKARIEMQDAYTLHRPARKRFLRNPYTVANVIEMWECHLSEVQSLAKHNAMHGYILSVIDVFSKYLNPFPLKTENGPSVVLGRFGPFFTTTLTRSAAAAPYGYVHIRARNF